MRKMRRDKRVASAALLVIATLMLSACGPDDSEPAASTSASAISDNTAMQDATSRTPAASASDALAPYAANPAAASDPIAQNMQASLAADNRQVAPVMHYAPGDNASTN